MSERKKFASLAILMVGVCLLGTGIGFISLYGTAFEQYRSRLIGTARSQSVVIEAIARFARATHPGDSEAAEAATLSQIQDAHADP